jgi:hypothetical protein
MKIYTVRVVQIEDMIGVYTPVSEQSFDYEGPVELCKGDSTAKAAEQQQLAFNTQLMNIFSQQFGQQSQIFNFLKGKMQPMIDNPTGLSAEGLAAARTSSTDQFSAAYQNAQKALNAKMAASGESTLPSGVGAQLNEALLNAEAADKATGQNQITMQNEQLKQQNYWNAINALNGVATQENPLGYAQSATAGSGAVANLSQAVTAANGPGIGQILGGAVGGVVGAAGAAGGFSKLFGCWIASKIFNGSLDPRTLLVREYIHFGNFSKTWYGKIVSRLYMKHGLWVSQQAILVKIFTPVFELALSSAQEAA